MQKLLLLILATTTFFSCYKRKNDEFELNIEQHAGSNAINRTIVTNARGEVLKIFENAFDVYKLKESIPYNADDPANATLDVHWILGDQSGYSIAVYSSLGIESGAFVLLRGEGYSTNENTVRRKVVLLVNGIPFQGSGWDLDIPGNDSYNSNLPNNGNLGLKIDLDINENLYLRAKKVSSQNWVEYFVPINQLQDTLYAKIQDFKSPNPFIKIPIDRLNGWDLAGLLMTEFSPDLQYYTTLHTTGYNSPPSDNHPGFILPQGHFLPSAFRLNTGGRTSNGYWNRDKIFQFGEELRIRKPDLIIHDWESVPGKEVSLFVEGQPDIVSVGCLIEKDQRRLSWEIEGSLERFLPYQLPDLQAYLPRWVEPASLFAKFHVRAWRFDHLNIDEYRSGLPDRSQDVFARAKSGILYVYK
jgi:hypothetical protein